MNEEWQRVAANAIAHAAEQAGAQWQCSAFEYARPSVVYRPSLILDGNQWCVLYGENIQTGVCGFGYSPAEAMHEFDKAWTRRMVPSGGTGHV